MRISDWSSDVCSSDLPVEMADYQRVDFNVDGIPHALVLSGRAEADLPRLAHDLTRICHVEREMFGQQPKLDQYLFLTNVVASGYGGLRSEEHTSELQSLMRISYAVLCLKKKKQTP